MIKNVFNHKINFQFISFIHCFKAINGFNGKTESVLYFVYINIDLDFKIFFNELSAEYYMKCSDRLT